ncbi:Membrane-bound lytic murein transglycosylase D precursor [Thioalkalivibrio nitratireducens DSM 14787]|uniref:Membrane-bound lytic murein transglycosylase D n=1 Tax=Thioalkalivibrio nitratireducens (strain DSM 14787 / UNIQEM 213 / ALEN2) TaxID=1255043 RepID=L0DZA4_THIND|nr:LysM peptidoglycan-binding domain-containing protein [Thioalkalivibrio nitratireducens]AGA34363.1 Membrane-bound lytic murein transglycosylase D precursor [Thioalkalivibrio nitratireducens DSM 14787]
MITRLLPVSIVVAGAVLFATGCSLHDSAKAGAATETAGETVGGEPAASARRGPSLSRDASRALRRTALRPEDAPDIWSRARISFEFTEHLDDPRVLHYVEHYRSNPNIIAVSSARAKPFAHFILTEIERRGLPGELLLLPIVESGYAAEATSSGRAAGIWQFIPSTGEHFGLIQDDWYDGRRDVYQSTHAALDYLERLHARFGDWYLALAAYNFGQGNVARAIAANTAAGQPTDYWSLRLSSEAMSYVPRLLALRALFEQPSRHNVTLPVIANRPYLEPVELGRQADLEYVAELARIEAREVLTLNPGYRRSITHPHAAQHLLLPAPAAQRLQTALRQRGADHPLVRYTDYQVRPGDTLGQIAQRHGLSVAELRGQNRLNGDLIRVGQTLRIPASGHATNSVTVPARAISAPRKYTVQAGDSLWGIARGHAVSVVALREHNGLGADAVLQPGQVLRLPAVAETVSSASTQRMQYRIRPGDSLNAISRRFQVEISDVQRWNSLNGYQIRAGDTLTLYVAANLLTDG